ncbi:MAG: DUF5659 domain-containing protein [candidate division Zixibacteria bacterium]|nr:DUF5659 domain-containing protein [candidate division Zixibacteria bacterium]
MSKNNDYYETTDLAFASFLIASGYSNLVDIRRDDHGKKIFVFNPCPPEQAFIGFYNGSEKVSAIRLIESYQNLKLATYVFKSNGG